MDDLIIKYLNTHFKFSYIFEGYFEARDESGKTYRKTDLLDELDKIFDICNSKIVYLLEDWWNNKIIMYTSDDYDRW